MTLGKNIFNLRKKANLSQEQLGEEVNVTRQTISNWELDETTPNPEQLKLLSQVLNVSVDDLLDNDLKNIIVDKVSKTEKYTKYISKIMKYLITGFIIILIIDIISFAYFYINKKGPFEENKKESVSYIINEKEIK